MSDNDKKYKEFKERIGSFPNRRSASAAFSLAFFAAAFGWTSTAKASAPALQAPSQESLQQGSSGGGIGGFMTGIERRDSLLGDFLGVRSFLSRYGISFAMSETSEVLGNVTGGTKKGFEYDGLTQMALQLETERAFGWHGGLFNVSALQIHGRNLSVDNLSSLQTASGIESDRATRLWELWYQQKFLDDDRMDIKIGQQSLDQEFIVSQNALLFVNTMFGWPMLPSADLPGGGPAYPLSALGVRLRARPIDSITVLAGIYNGSPVKNGDGDPQQVNASGTQFPLNGGSLAFLEFQYSYPSLGTMLYADQPEPLSRTYKIGMWYDSERFADQQYSNDGLSLANPASNGNPRNSIGNYSIYAVVDQMVWQSAEELDRSISFFARAMIAPEQNRNLIYYSLNAGFNFKEPFEHRDDDTFGIGMGYTQVGKHSSNLDRDTILYAGSLQPVRSEETYIEVTYQYELTPWWQIQPDFQYVFNPGGGLQDPNGTPGQRIKDEAVLGIRTNITF